MIGIMDIGHLIQSAVAPVFLLSGVGVTLGVLTNRLARIVDRARVLEEKLGRAVTFKDKSAGTDARRRAIDLALRVLVRRARYINVAITLSTTSALLVSLVVILLFASAFLDLHLPLAIALVFVASMIVLTGAYVAFLIEVRIATAALRIGTPY